MTEKIRKHKTISGTIYIQKKEFNEQGELIKGFWQREKDGKIEELVDAAHISRHQHNILKPDFKNKLPNELMEIAKKENYIWDKGLIFFIRKDYSMWHSSLVKEVEPPYTREDFEKKDFQPAELKPAELKPPKLKPDKELKPPELKPVELKPAKELKTVKDEIPFDFDDSKGPSLGEIDFDNLEGSSLGEIDFDNLEDGSNP